MKSSVFAWLCAMIVVLGLVGNRAWGFFEPPQPAPGVFATSTPESIGENYDAWRYDAPDYLLAANNTTRVGCWMSDAEYAAMVKNGTVPPNPAAFKPPPQSPNFVEFDVPTSQRNIHDVGNGWGRVWGPGSLEARLAASKGLPVPPATNIKVTTP